MNLGTGIFASVGVITFVVCLHTKVGRRLLISILLIIAAGYGALLVVWHQQAIANAAAHAAKVADYCAAPKNGGTGTSWKDAPIIGYGKRIGFPVTDDWMERECPHDPLFGYKRPTLAPVEGDPFADENACKKPGYSCKPTR
jgi:hypothetical protein